MGGVTVRQIASPKRQASRRLPSTAPLPSTPNRAKGEQEFPLRTATLRLPKGAVALGTESIGFCNSNAAGTVGLAAMLITSLGFRRIETETLTHVRGERHASLFRGGPHRFVLVLRHPKVAGLAQQGRLTASMVTCQSMHLRMRDRIASRCEIPRLRAECNCFRVDEEIPPGWARPRRAHSYPDSLPRKSGPYASPGLNGHQSLSDIASPLYSCGNRMSNSFHYR